MSYIYIYIPFLLQKKNIIIIIVGNFYFIDNLLS